MSLKKTDGGMTAMHMSMDDILSQLSSLKDNSADMASAPDADSIWSSDVDALEAAIGILSALQDEGITDTEAVKDLLHDYNAQAKQCREMHRKYETPTRAVRRDGVWHCPECNHRVQPKHTFCHWCGKKLGGW